MKTIGERAKEYSLKDFDGYYTGREKALEEGYIAGATEQNAADIEWLRNNWRKYIYQDRDGVILFNHWESDFRKSMRG